MSLERISKDDAEAVLLLALGDHAMQGCAILGDAFEMGIKNPLVAITSLKPEFQAKLANEVLDEYGHNQSERYVPQDFAEVHAYVPLGLPQPVLQHICSNVTAEYKRYVAHRNKLE